VIDLFSASADRGKITFFDRFQANAPHPGHKKTMRSRPTLVGFPSGLSRSKARANIARPAPCRARRRDSFSQRRAGRKSTHWPLFRSDNVNNFRHAYLHPVSQRTYVFSGKYKYGTGKNEPGIFFTGNEERLPIADEWFVPAQTNWN
jgi:hypothetical protein